MTNRSSSGFGTAHAHFETLENRTLLSGNLDPTFGNGGIVSAPALGGYDETVTGAVTPQGKLVLQTYDVYTGGPPNGAIDITQYTAAGQPDPTFGTNGSIHYVVHPTPTSDGYFDDLDHDNKALAQPDGKLVVIKTVQIINSAGTYVGSRIFAIRFNQDGSVDPTFNSTPALNFTFGKLTDEGDEVVGAALQADGKILILADSSGSSGHSNAGVLRLNADGSIDKTYGRGGGFLKLGAGSFEMDAALDQFGRLVVGYNVDSTQPYGYALPNKGQFAVYRLTTTGAIDQTFNHGNLALGPQVPYSLREIGNVAIDSTGDILIDGGLATADPNNPLYTYAATRFLATGKLDTTFGKNGIAIGPFESLNPGLVTDFSKVDGLALQSDGKLLILSQGADNDGYEATVTRLTTSGAIDITFGTNGSAFAPGRGPVMIAFQPTPQGGFIYAGFADGGNTTPEGARWLDDSTNPVPQALKGKVIGTTGSFRNLGNTIANVFDQNVDTFFDAPSASGAWVGLDLGSATVVKQIQFVGRVGYESRMVGGEFQASNSASFSTGVVTLATIKTAPAPGAASVVNLSSLSAYRYFRYIGPAGSYCDIAELAFLG